MRRNIFKLLLCIAICLMLCVCFVACGGDDLEERKGKRDKDTQATDSAEGSDSGADASIELDPNSFNIFYSGDFVCDIVIPENATDIEKTVANTIKAGLQKKTGKNILIAKEGDERIDESNSLILVGKTSYEESTGAYKGLKARSAKIKTTKTRMTVAFNNVSSGVAVAEKLVTEINKGEKQALKIKTTFIANYTSLPERIELVEYTGGKTQELESENGTVLYTSYGNTLSAFNEYCDKLSQIGFDVDQEFTASNNSFKTFRGEDVYVHAYYVNQSLTKTYTNTGSGYKHDTKDVSGVVKIAVGPIETFAAADMSNNQSAKYTPQLAIIPVPSATLDEVGQGYVFVLPDGRLIIQDSGVDSIAHPDYMYEYIKQIAPDPNNVVIAAWFLSHPHGDHQGAFLEYVKNHGSDVNIKIERVIYNYTKAELYDLIRYDCPWVDGKPAEEKSANQVTTFYNTVKQYIPDVPLLVAHTGQVFDFGNGATVEVLFTVEDIVPEELENPNNSSMVIRVNIAGQKTLLLADTAHKSNPMLVKMWGNYLKADIVQIAHHGIWTPDDGIYDLIGAKVTLWPSTYTQAKASFNHYDSNYSGIVKKIYNLTSDLYVSDATLRVLNLPYVIQNNKATEKTKIDNAK